MEKKQILFLCSNMAIGGFQKSLVNLLQFFDYEKYDVDLLLLEENGVFEKYINKKVNIIYASKIESDYCRDVKTAVVRLIKAKHYFWAIKRLINAGISILNKGLGAIMMSRQLVPLRRKYDCCIDYCGQYLNYYMNDKIDAKKKITYFHNDYSKWPYYQSADKKYFKKDDYIVTVSDGCVQSLAEFFPEQKNKIVCIENIISKETIFPFLNDVDKPEEFIDGRLVIVSVGRLVSDKGTDLAIKVCSKLKKRYNIEWIWVGPGDIEYYNQLVKENNVENEFIMVGGKENPYPYMEHADLIVHPARFEGKAVAVEEALIMNKLLVATDYSTVHNQIVNGETGIICDSTTEAITKAIIELLNNEEKKEYILKNQLRLCTGNSSEVNKLYSLIEQ